MASHAVTTVVGTAAVAVRTESNVSRTNAVVRPTVMVKIAVMTAAEVAAALASRVMNVRLKAFARASQIVMVNPVVMTGVAVAAAHAPGMSLARLLLNAARSNATGKNAVTMVVGACAVHAPTKSHIVSTVPVNLPASQTVKVRLAAMMVAVVCVVVVTPPHRSVSRDNAKRFVQSAR